MRYFVNGNYSLETLREEFKAYAKKLHPYFGSGNNQEFRELLDEYIAYRRHIQEKYKERYQAEKGRKKPRPTYDPNKKPHHEMKLRNTNKGVYIDGPVEVIFDYRKEIMMHGGTFNPYTKQWEAYTEGGIRERMTAARLGYRSNQRDTIEQLTREIEALKQENTILKNKLKELGQL